MIHISLSDLSAFRIFQTPTLLNYPFEHYETTTTTIPMCHYFTAHLLCPLCHRLFSPTLLLVPCWNARSPHPFHLPRPEILNFFLASPQRTTHHGLRCRENRYDHDPDQIWHGVVCAFCKRKCKVELGGEVYVPRRWRALTAVHSEGV